MCGTARPFSIQNNLTTILPVGDGIIVSTRTGIVLSGTNPVLPSVPLVSSEGVHALQYFSVDNALNYEFPKGATIYAAGYWSGRRWSL